MDTLRLKRGSTLRIKDGAGMVIEVSHGEIWLTQERDPRDHFIHAGDWLRIDQDGTVVLSAVGDEAWIGLTALRPEDWDGRVVLSGIGSKGPLQMFPARRPELVARLLGMLGLTRAAHSA